MTHDELRLMNDIWYLDKSRSLELAQANFKEAFGLDVHDQRLDAEFQIQFDDALHNATEDSDFKLFRALLALALRNTGQSRRGPQDTKRQTLFQMLANWDDRWPELFEKYQGKYPKHNKAKLRREAKLNAAKEILDEYDGLTNIESAENFVDDYAPPKRRKLRFGDRYEHYFGNVSD